MNKSKPSRKYYDTSLKNLDDIRKNIIRNVAYLSHNKIYLDIYKTKDNNFPWKCYICHTKINVEFFNFKGSSLFCDEHKPNRFDNKYKKDHIFLRYINTFFTSIKNKIKKNTNSDIYGQY